MLQLQQVLTALRVPLHLGNDDDDEDSGDDDGGDDDNASLPWQWQ